MQVIAADVRRARFLVAPSLLKLKTVSRPTNQSIEAEF
jgi:hypothetical protein